MPPQPNPSPLDAAVAAMDNAVAGALTVNTPSHAGPSPSPIAANATIVPGAASAGLEYDPSLPDASELLGGRMLDNLKAALGDAWQSKLSPSERQLAMDVMNDLAGLTLVSVASGKPFAGELAQIEAQLAGIASIEFDRTRHFVMVAAGRAAFSGVEWLVTATAPYLIAAV